ncbi:hypothetical protein DBV15_08280 [Temnothorax longispinosus]|uniref:Uncharacterized protein n=1 Tax=Temnothorax longispinosus TaxID=300112 RepID=A0A4S2KH46_9HYME|nr:hypothetical protein DBV15_08280 [Temnothorax longispinosus]
MSFRYIEIDEKDEIESDIGDRKEEKTHSPSVGPRRSHEALGEIIKFVPAVELHLNGHLNNPARPATRLTPSIVLFPFSLSTLLAQISNKPPLEHPYLVSDTQRLGGFESLKGARLTDPLLDWMEAQPVSRPANPERKG